MKIYIFSIKTPEGTSICQVYANCYIEAFYSLVLISGCNVEDMAYHDKDITTCPLNWI